MTLHYYVFSRHIEGSSLKTSMHLYCDVTSLCKFGALKSYLFLVLWRVPLSGYLLAIYSIICLVRILCITDSCLIHLKIIVPIISPYTCTAMLKTPVYSGSFAFQIVDLFYGP